jgi:heme-degrading monooxygenase HmoA
MSFVAINVLTVRDDAGRTLEERFARRAGSVESSPGFEHFELLRPVEGTSDYLVYTRWRSRDDYEAWTRSASFARGHTGAGTGPGPADAAQSQRPAATGSTIWAFEVVQNADPIRPDESPD